MVVCLGVAANGSSKPSTTKAKLTTTGDKAKEEEDQNKMEEDQCQAEIDAQMQNFLNMEKTKVSAPTPTPTPTPQGAQGNGMSTKDDVSMNVHEKEVGDLRLEMNSQLQRVMEMVKAVEERQSKAEQRQDLAEKRIEGAIAEIVAEHKSSAASTANDIGDLKSMMMMVAQQQQTIMQTLQNDDRRVKPKVDTQAAQ